LVRTAGRNAPTSKLGTDENQSRSDGFVKRVLHRTLAAAAALVLSGALAACGASASSSGSSGSSPGSSASGPTTLKVWIMGSSGQNFSKLTAGFTKSTGISVDVQAIPWADVDTKLTTAVASGNGPDVVQIGLSNLPTFVSSGALMDLSPYMSSHPALASSNFLGAVSTDKLNPAGKVLSVPWISDVRVLFYRTDIFQQAGIQGPPTTWAQLHADAVKLATRGSGKYGYYIPQWDAPLPIEFTWDAGGSVMASSGKVNFDTPAFRQAVDFYASFYRGKLVPTAADFDQTAGFISGSAPMLVSGPYLAQSLTGIQGKWASAPLPSDSTNTSLFAGSTLGVWHTSTKVAAALKLFDFLAQPSTQVAWYKLDGDLPSNNTALSDPSLTSDPNFQVYAKQLQNSELLPLVPQWDTIQNDMLTAVNKIVLTGANETSTLSQLDQTVAGLQK
jgi:multiple sugar transport system substrate-binding protein